MTSLYTNPEYILQMLALGPNGQGLTSLHAHMVVALFKLLHLNTSWEGPANSTDDAWMSVIPAEYLRGGQGNGYVGEKERRWEGGKDRSLMLVAMVSLKREQWANSNSCLQCIIVVTGTRGVQASPVPTSHAPAPHCCFPYIHTYVCRCPEHKTRSLLTELASTLGVIRTGYI